MKFPHLTDVQPLPDFQLQVRFADETETIVDFREQLSTPIMHSIATPEAFATARIAESNSFVFWDVDVPPIERPDASSDWLYLQSLPAEARERFQALLASAEDWDNAAAQIRSEYGPQMFR
jgi:hypothetical protein